MCAITMEIEHLSKQIVNRTAKLNKQTPKKTIQVFSYSVAFYHRIHGTFFRTKIPFSNFIIPFSIKAIYHTLCHLFHVCASRT